MNEQNYRPFWDEVLRLLREEYKEKGLEEEFTLWFNMEYVKDNLNEITVSVPSKFMWTQLIQKGYVKAVQDKILELTGHSVNITYIAKSPLPKVAEPINTSPTLQFKETDNLLAKESVPKKEIFLEKKQHPQLDENYTFDTFIPGENSEFAYRVAQAAAKEPGFKNYNPLLIYGGVGLGKTHLMQSIGNYIYKQNGGNVKICCVTAEEFTNEFIASIGNKQNIEKFKSKYRKLDVLLVDDIHFFIGKDSTQEELFHTFEALQQKHAQMVFTCDRPITELKELLKRLSSRLSSGTTVDLKLPDYETRIAILKNEISLLGKKQIIPQEIIEFIAKNVQTNVRDLKACLQKILNYAGYMETPLTTETAQDLLRDIFSQPASGTITIERIQKVVAEHYNISLSDIKSIKRNKKIAFPRHIAIYIARELGDYAYTEIADEFGGRNHSTIMHSHDLISDQLKTDSMLDTTIQMLIREIKDYKK